jgi:uncharacterized protein (DUF58 family)
MRLRDRIVGRAARWARKRQGLDPLPLVLRARRLYILPTRAGLGFALLLLVMLVAGLNYTNSLALLLTFVLAGYVLVGMHECQRTLQGLELSLAQAADCHAGSVGTVELRFANPSPAPRRALRIRCAPQGASQFDMPAGAQLAVHLAFEAGGRGRQQLGRLHLSSTAPFGLFRCWTWLHLPTEVIVYPSAAGNLPLPAAHGGRRSLQPLAAAPGEDDWASLRAYQAGDSPRSIAWKAWARGAPLMVSQYEGAGGSERLLTFAGLGSLDLEARLSQLCAWIVECSRMDVACGLSLPGVEIPPGRGAGHRVALLRALALYGTDPA